MDGGLITRLGNWVAKPFTQDINLGDVILVTTLLLIAVFFWTRILGDIMEVE